MTTKIIPSPNGSLQVFNGRTASNEVVPFNDQPIRLFDLRLDELPVSGVDEEFDIDDYIEQQDAPTKKAVADAGEWVAETLYPGRTTLATLRLRAGLSQRELAERCGMEQPHISRYESGKHEPGVFQAQVMAGALGISLDELVAALQEAATPGKQ